MLNSTQDTVLLTPVFVSLRSVKCCEPQQPSESGTWGDRFGIKRMRSLYIVLSSQARAWKLGYPN